MKNSYPIIIHDTNEEEGYLVYIPDFDINTEGNTITESIEMARDAIGLIGIVMEDDGKELPEPSRYEDVKKEAGDIVTLVDIDFTEYRKKNNLIAAELADLNSDDKEFTYQGKTWDEIFNNPPVDMTDEEIAEAVEKVRQEMSMEVYEEILNKKKTKK